MTPEEDEDEIEEKKEGKNEPIGFCESCNRPIFWLLKGFYKLCGVCGWKVDK